MGAMALTSPILWAYRAAGQPGLLVHGAQLSHTEVRLVKIVYFDVGTIVH
jgi:hypothetical protein